MHEYTAEAASPRQDREIAELALLADALVEQVSEARRQYSELRAEIDGTEPTEDAEREPVPAPVAHVDEEVRLYAHRLALMGVEPEEARMRLHHKFELDDAGPMVEAVYGAAPPPPPAPLKRRFRRLRRGG